MESEMLTDKENKRNSASDSKTDNGGDTAIGSSRSFGSKADSDPFVKTSSDALGAREEGVNTSPPNYREEGNDVGESFPNTEDQIP